MLYSVVLIYVIYLIYNYDYLGLERKSMSFHWNLLLIVVVLVSGLSYRLGIDCVRYEQYFYDYKGALNFRGLFTDEMFVSTREPLWVLLNTVILKVFNEYQVLKIVVAAFVNCVIFWFIRKHSYAPYTTVLFYLVLNYFHFNFEILRESIAVAFVLIALDKLLCDEKGLLKYYIWIIPACLSHHFAFVSVLFPLFTNIKSDKAFYITLLLFLLAIPFLTNSLLHVQFISIINDDLSEDFMNHALNEKNLVLNKNVTGYLVIVFLEILPLVLFAIYSSLDKIRSISFFCILFTIFQLTSFMLIYRLNDFIFIPSAIAFSDGVRNLLYKGDFISDKTKLPAKVVFGIAIAFFGYKIYQYIQSDFFCMYYPYSSIIDKTLDSAREVYFNNL